MKVAQHTTQPERSDASHSDQATAATTKIVAAATIGTIIEIYDWVLLAIFSVPISKTFFPSTSDTSAILLTLATVAIGVVVRPIGAVVLGRLADRAGRREALSVTLLLMGMGILISAACPGYATIGIAAPVIMVIGRILQGISAGGEVGCSLTVLVESAAPERKRFLASLMPASQYAGTLLAGSVGVALTYLLSDQQIADGGWRFAYVLGLCIVPVGMYLRKSMVDEHFVSHSVAQSEQSGWKQAKRYQGALLYCVFIVLFATAGTYASNYFAVYATRNLHLPMRAGYLGQVVVGVVGVVSGPLFGIVASRVGTRVPMLLGAVGTAILAYPMLKYLTVNPSVPTLLVVQAVQVLLVTAYFVGASATIAEQFPKSFRATGSSVSYTLAVTIFGGMSPLVVTALISATGSDMAFAFYLAGAALISAVTLLARRSTSAVLV